MGGGKVLEMESEKIYRSGVADGTLSQERFELFKSLHSESEKSAKMKAISKQRKIINKNRR